jgi:hypothetical protein
MQIVMNYLCLFLSKEQFYAVLSQRIARLTLFRSKYRIADETSPSLGSAGYQLGTPGSPQTFLCDADADSHDAVGSGIIASAR